MKMKKKEDPNQNSIELDLLEDSENNNKENSEKINKIFGNDIDIKNPKRLGNLRAFLYINDYPLIVLGPNCKYFY